MADFISSRQLRQAHPPHADALPQAPRRTGRGACPDSTSASAGLSAGLNLVLTLPDGTEHEVLRRAGEAGIALPGLSIMRHPLAGPEVADPDGIIVGFAAPADHAFTAAVNALLDVLKAVRAGKVVGYEPAASPDSPYTSEPWRSSGGRAVGDWYMKQVAPRLDPPLLRLTGGRVSSAYPVPVMLLTTTGAKTGQPRDASAGVRHRR